MRIKIRQLDGRIDYIETNKNEEIKRIKEKLREKMKETTSGCDCLYEIIYKKKKLENNKTIKEYKINEESKIYAIHNIRT
mmetsp:Transcript_10536/g.15399  ORF Transcript_10536/g.15399 Transcript_10536/m.15399 type:complete len:80 (+) Transcript_10536:27-266(+)